MSIFRPTPKKFVQMVALCAIFSCAWALHGCATLGATLKADTSESSEPPDLEATRLEICQPFGRTWDLEGNAQSLEVFRNHDQWVLVYETMMRNGPRTVWQPLRPDLAFDGDGIVVGQKNLPLISDFRVQHDPKRNSWISYRAKRHGSELYSSFIEFLPSKDGKGADTLHRIRIPTNASESVQEVWVLPTSSHGVASVVVRVNPFTESGEEITLFRWYAVTPARNQAKVVGEFRSNSVVLASTRFIPMAKTFEPIAFSIMSQSQAFEAADPKYQRSSFKLVAKRLFTRAKEEVTLYESPTPLANLALESAPKPSTTVNTLLTWLQEPSEGANSLVQWAPLRFDATEAGFQALKKSQPRLAPKFLEVVREPARLRMRTLRTGALAIAWWTASDEHSAYLVTPIWPQPPELSVDDGYDSTGNPRKKLRPVTSGVFASEKRGRILGIAEGAGPNGADVLFMSQPMGEKKPDSGTTITSCAIRARS